MKFIQCRGLIHQARTTLHQFVMGVMNVAPTLFLFLFLSCSHEIYPEQIEKGPQTLDKNAVITGTVSVKEGLSPKGVGTLFVIARSKGQEQGPPLAVQRIQEPVFPIGFQLSQKNVMLPGKQFQGEVVLAVKWSKSGNPMLETSGDLKMSKGKAVAVGTKDVQLVLDEKIH